MRLENLYSRVEQQDRVIERLEEQNQRLERQSKLEKAGFYRVLELNHKKFGVSY